MEIKPWLQAFRLRTLPLAIGAITMGAFAANIAGFFRWDIYLMAILTATFLQILSNLANDYGDFKKGTDNENRVGPARALQSGIITEKAMLRAVVLFSILSLIGGVLLSLLGFGTLGNPKTVLMIALGLASIAAAIKYTVGKSAYGYSGLGDVFVFIFFGLVAVGGTYFLMAKTIEWRILWPAASFGCLAAGVLNINNIRDIDNDKASNKITLAVRLGRRRAQYFQLFLMLGAISTLLASVMPTRAWYLYLAAIVLFIPISISFSRVMKNKPGQEPMLNRELKSLSLGSALLSVVVFGLSFLL